MKVDNPNDSADVQTLIEISVDGNNIVSGNWRKVVVINGSTQPYIGQTNIDFDGEFHDAKAQIIARMQEICNTYFGNL